MENKQTEKKQQKSVILLLIFIFLLLNAGMMFRAGINTLYFTHDTSSEYVPVEATVEELRPEKNIRAGIPPRIIPVFSFTYNGRIMTMEAPGLAFAKSHGKSFKKGEKYTLWVHKNRGELILPPRAGLKETGRSQLITSAVCLLLAVVVWIVRGRTGAKAAA